jgi:hypothetical protein
VKNNKSRFFIGLPCGRDALLRARDQGAHDGRVDHGFNPFVEPASIFTLSTN